ncbi:unnamed protein product [Protopolystoma xenopodis]|uniref:Uncharacterized protein n=1 Tax=Protopolystoma xenopodis TaxID=117903 RepID=A0A3S5AVZ0_9PLAT|nr:unnamed protein product [Protopolystoma xenopodis]
MVTSAPSAFSSSSIGPSLVYASGEPAASQNSTSAHITHAYYVYPNSSASLANLGLAGTPGVGASRLRSSAWRRAGGLSARALPFYPTVTTSEPNTPISEQSETTAAGYLSASQTTVNNSAAAAAAAIAAAFAASTFSTSNGSLHSNIHTIGISSTNSNTSINTSTVLETGNSIFSPAVLSNTATSNSSVRQSIVGPGRPSLITPTANVSPQSFPSGSQSPQRLSPGFHDC